MVSRPRTYLRCDNGLLKSDPAKLCKAVRRDLCKAAKPPIDIDSEEKNDTKSAKEITN